MCASVEVKTSTIAGAGKGLFARQHFKRGDIITLYSGKVLTDADPWPYGDDLYVVRLGLRKYLDGHERFTLDKKRHLGLRINHSPKNKNARFSYLASRIKNPARIVEIKATRRIAPGEEIFLDYGPEYFKNLERRPNDPAP
jgi:SET domain-containing protein